MSNGGWIEREAPMPGLGMRNWYKTLPLGGELNVLVSIDDGEWHLSISHRLNGARTSVPGRYPTYEEIKEARYRFVPDEVTMAMLFPPTKEWVNVHNTTFHLWQVPDDVGVQ